MPDILLENSKPEKDTTTTEETTVDDTVDQTVEETTETESSETEESTVDETTGETTDETVDDDSLPEKEYLAQFELPGHFNTVEDLVKAYKEVLPEMKRSQTEAQKIKQIDEQLKKLGYAGGFSALEMELQKSLSGGGQMAAPTKIEGTNFNDLLVESVKAGTLDRDLATQMVPFAPIFDTMFKKAFEAVENAMQFAKSGVEGIQAGQTDNELWTAFASQYKGLTPEDRGRLRDLKNKHQFETYEEAYAWGKVKDPDFLKSITAKAEADAQKSVIKRLRLDARPGQNQRGGGGGKGLTLRSFADPDGTINTDKMLTAYRQKRLSEAQYRKFMEEATRLSGAL
jgi:hypothetical protein